MSSVFTSHVTRTRTLGNQSFHFQSIFTTTMNVDLPTPLTCPKSNNQPIYLQYHLAPNFTSHTARTRSVGKLRFFFTSHLSVVPQMSIMRIRTLPVSSIIFIFNPSLSLSSPCLTP